MEKEVTVNGKILRVISRQDIKESQGLMFSMDLRGIIYFGMNVQQRFGFIKAQYSNKATMMVDEIDNIYVKFIQSDSEDAFKIISTGGTYSIRQANPITQKYINLGITKFVLVLEDIEQGIYKVEAFSPNNKNHM